MAQSETSGGATPWLAFFVGIFVVALIVGGYFALNGTPHQQTAQLNVNLPRIERPVINPPSISPPTNPPTVQPPRASGS